MGTTGWRAKTTNTAWCETPRSRPFPKGRFFTKFLPGPIPLPDTGESPEAEGLAFWLQR